MPASGSGPLAGIKVVDLTSYIAGSYGAMMLADMGASVVKVEALEGDSFRELPGFYGWNRGKRSIAVNLKEPDGLAIVHKLAREADVAMDNMRVTREFFNARMAEKKPGDLIHLTIFRFDDLSTLLIKLGERREGGAQTEMAREGSAQGDLGPLREQFLGSARRGTRGDGHSPIAASTA